VEPKELPIVRLGVLTRYRCYWHMDQSSSGRLDLLQAVLRKGEQDLARQRQLIEDLRCDGHRTTEAEDVLRRFETACQAVLAKLNVLKRGEPAD
jgi:hypothetical protein